MPQVTNTQGRDEGLRPGASVASAYSDPSGIVVTHGAEDTTISAASITKTVVAATTVILAGRGELDLEQPLKEVIPEGVSWTQEPTWLDVLAHTGGFPYELRKGWWWANDPLRDDDLRSALAEVRLMPAGQWHYSNAGYQVIALALEELTSCRWDELANDLVCVPAGMYSTGIGLSAAEGGTAGYAAGGLTTTLGDLCRLGAILGGHRPDVLPPHFLQTLTAPRAVATNGLIQAAGPQLSVGERTRILTWGTAREVTIGLLVEPGLHSVALSIDQFGAGKPMLAKLLETSDAVRRGLDTNEHGLWWADGVQIEVTEFGGRLIARDPQSPTLLTRTPLGDVRIEETRIELPEVTLWRSLEDSAW